MLVANRAPPHLQRRTIGPRSTGERRRLVTCRVAAQPLFPHRHKRLRWLDRIRRIYRWSLASLATATMLGSFLYVLYGAWLGIRGNISADDERNWWVEEYRGKDGPPRIYGFGQPEGRPPPRTAPELLKPITH